MICLSHGRYFSWVQGRRDTSLYFSLTPTEPCYRVPLDLTCSLHANSKYCSLAAKGTVNHDVFWVFLGGWVELGVCVWVSVSVCVCMRRGRDRGSESPLTTWISPLMLTGLDINNVAFHSPHPPLRSLPRTHTYALFLSLSLFLVFTVYFSVCVTVHVLLFVPIHKEMAL